MQARQIRAAVEQDLPSLIEIGRRSWLSAFWETAPFGLLAWWVKVDRVARLYDEHWRSMLVLEEYGSLIGLVQPKDDEINGLWVHPSSQRTGAGSLLLRAGEQVIKQGGHSTAWLTCSGLNVGALNFYRSRGYVETARTSEMHASGFEIPSIRLQRQLDDVSAIGG